MIINCRSRGYECQHVLEIGLAEACDAEIWQYAEKEVCIVMSKDEDFLYLAKRGESAARFIWVRLGNCRTAALVAAIEHLWMRIEEALAAGERVVEVR